MTEARGVNAGCAVPACFSVTRHPSGTHCGCLLTMESRLVLRKKQPARSEKEGSQISCFEMKAIILGRSPTLKMSLLSCPQQQGLRVWA